MMNGGSIELLEASGTVLATLKLSNPAASPAVNGELNSTRSARASPRPRASSDGAYSLAGRRGSYGVDVGDECSDAVIRLNTTQIARGSPVRIGSFTIAMP